MMEEFKQMLLKRQKEQLKKPVDKDRMAAKANMMKELSGLLSKDMAGDMDHMKKVTVASDSKEGLEKGLDKAKEVVEKRLSPEQMLKDMRGKDMNDHMLGDNEPRDKDDPVFGEADTYSAEDSEHEADECDSEEGMEQEIKKLSDKLAEMRAKKA